MSELKRRRGTWRYDEDAKAYEFVLATAPAGRMVSEAIATLDVAADGTLAGVELVQGVAIDQLPRMPLGDIGTDGNAFWTYDDEAGAVYVAPVQRCEPPYRVQNECIALLCLAEDGSLASIKLVSSVVPPPPRRWQLSN